MSNTATNNTKYIVLEDDVISIMYNDLLKTKPFLIRMTNFNNEQYEVRADKEDVEKLIQKLNELIKGA